MILRRVQRNLSKGLCVACGAKFTKKIFEQVSCIDSARYTGKKATTDRAKPFFYHFSEPISPLQHTNFSLRRVIKSVENTSHCKIVLLIYIIIWLLLGKIGCLYKCHAKRTLCFRRVAHVQLERKQP